MTWIWIWTLIGCFQDETNMSPLGQNSPEPRGRIHLEVEAESGRVLDHKQHNITHCILGRSLASFQIKESLASALGQEGQLRRRPLASLVLSVGK